MKVETEKAMKERNYLMKELKVKERRGSIFIDKVSRVVAAIARPENPEQFNFLIEWKFCKVDKIVPTMTVVRGSHFAFSNPLLYRRYVEKNYIHPS